MLWEALVKTHKYCIYWPPTAYSGRILYYRPFGIKFYLLRALEGTHEDP
jgi:hypothetical protein